MHNPWYVEGDTDERNSRAKKAFTALLTVTARTPESIAYRNFSNEVFTIASCFYLIRGRLSMPRGCDSVIKELVPLQPCSK